jgi:hypothetical protein
VNGFVGKYVCYGNKDGMFCWGRIKAEVEVNTMEGPKEAFILDERMSGPYSAGGCRIRKFKGDTVLRKDKINIETDIFDRDVREFDGISNDDLFLLVMDSTAGLERLKSLGQWNMLKSGMGQTGDDNIAAAVLKKRLGIEQDECPGNIGE